MSTTTDRITDFAKRGQDAVSGAFGTWTDAVTALTPFRPTAEDARGLLDSGFTAAQKVLQVQRDFARGVLDAGVQVVEKATEVGDEARSTKA
ncbi:hypothetical protein [Pseudonocardia xishanensis]|uniref:Excreted virulence factor EspC (Type VII ESX diderm) n=1 Tax=Pseudonocardia xishanensis TaxID=630995 RepID=A0ABP8RWD8_9PSEU